MKSALTWLRRNHPVSSVVLSPLVVAALVATIAWVVAELLGGPDWSRGSDVIQVSRDLMPRALGIAVVFVVTARSRRLRGASVRTVMTVAVGLLCVVMAVTLLPGIPELVRSRTLAGDALQSPERRSLCDPGPGQPFPSFPIAPAPGMEGTAADNIGAAVLHAIGAPSWLGGRLAGRGPHRMEWTFWPSNYCGFRVARDRHPAAIRILPSARMLEDVDTGETWLLSRSDAAAMRRMSRSGPVYRWTRAARSTFSSAVFAAWLVLLFFLPSGRHLQRDIHLRSAGRLVIAMAPLGLGWGTALSLGSEQSTSLSVAGILIAVVSFGFPWWMVLRAMHRNRYVSSVPVHWAAAVFGAAFLPQYLLLDSGLAAPGAIVPGVTLVVTVVALIPPLAFAHHRLEHLPD